MLLPEFPEFREVDISCGRIVRDYLARFPMQASEYTFTNIFAYRFAYDFRLSSLKNNLLLLKGTMPVSMFSPVGNTVIPSVLDEMFTYLNTYPSTASLDRVPEWFVNQYLAGKDRYLYEEKREHFDYLYSVRELIELKGNRFHDKRNQVNKFRSRYQYEYIPLSAGLIDECLAFEDFWCEVRECEKHPGLEKERCAILQMLYNFEPLRILGGAIRMENRIAALTVGEKISPDTMVIHIEKANPDIPGLYQIINQEFLLHTAKDCLYVNREQDLGIEGIRRAKLSYNPVSFVKKYRVQERN